MLIHYVGYDDGLPRILACMYTHVKEAWILLERKSSDVGSRKPGGQVESAFCRDSQVVNDERNVWFVTVGTLHQLPQAVDV
jgi:hypothetical protein